MLNTRIKAKTAAQNGNWIVRTDVQLDTYAYVEWVKGDLQIQADFDKAGRCIYVHRYNAASDVTDPVPTRDRAKVLLAWLAA